jgi:hypothetical protein
MTVDYPVDRRPIVRAVGVARAVAGGLVIARPADTARWISGLRGPRVVTTLARALGIRLAVQAMAELAWPTRRVVLASAAVDATHAFSMLVPYALGPRYRRAAVVNAATSSVTAALLAVEARAIPAER